MFRRSLLSVALPALGLAMTLVCTSPAAAGIFRGGWGGYGNGYYGNGYYGNGYYGNGYYGNGSYYGNGYGSGYYGNGYYGNGYGASNGFFGNGWDTGYTWNAYPTTPGWNYQPAATYSSGYAGPAASAVAPQHQDRNVSPDAARINVRVPADAQLWFDGGKTMMTGMNREFVTAALQADADNVYAVRAQWMHNGQFVDQTRQVRVNPGARVMVDFFQPAASEGAEKGIERAPRSVESLDPPVTTNKTTPRPTRTPADTAP